MATPKIEMKPTAAEMLKFVPVSSKAQTPPMREVEHVGKDDHRVEHVAEGDVEQHQDHGQRGRHDEHQAMLGLLHLLELAAPHGPVRGIEELLGPLLGFGHGAGQVAVADAELEGDQPFALLAINRRSAVPLDIGPRDRASRCRRRATPGRAAAGAACC